MKIGIITSNASFLDNYGAVLQAFALCSQLRRWGYDAEIINYEYNTGSSIVSADYKVNRSIGSILKYVLSKDSSFWEKVQYRLARKKRNETRTLFQQFVTENVPIDLSNPKTFDSLREETEHDCLICGSDQVWNPLIHANRNDPGFFLNFGKKEAKRIAYAPSFGVSKIPKSCEESLGKYLNNINYISVRETTGADIIKKTCGIDVPVLLDPTMMADPEIWDRFHNKPVDVSNHYIFVYRFGSLPFTEKMVETIRKKSSLPMIELPVSMDAYSAKTSLYYKAGPAEFVSLIKNADLVLTDSFHATVFSIMNHTPFYTFPRQGKSESGNMNNRMENLLDSMNLRDRFLSPDNEKKISFSPMDFSGADSIIKVRRNESQRFLLNALESQCFNRE